MFRLPYSRARSIAVACSLAMLVGCQTYRRAPLHLDAHVVRFQARSPADPAVRDLVFRLGAGSRPVNVAYDPSDGLAIAEAEATALVYNPGLRVARLEAAVASAGARTAGRWEDPVFGFDGERILASVTHPWIAAASIGITLPFSGRLDAEKRVACAEERAAIARVVAAEWELRTRVRARHIEWAHEVLRKDLMREFLARLDEVIMTAARLEESGAITRIEARVFRAERSARAIDLETVAARVEALALDLKGLLGLVPEAPVTFTEDLAIDLDAPDGLDRSPRLRALRAAYDVAEESLRLEIARPSPDLGVAPGGRVEDGDARATLGLDLPLPLWNRNARGIAEARARRELARAEFERGYEELVAALARARHDLAAATARKASVESSLVPVVDEQSSDVRAVAALGKADTLVMLDTLVRAEDARIRVLDARLAEALAAVRVLEITGQKDGGSR